MKRTKLKKKSNMPISRLQRKIWGRRDLARKKHKYDTDPEYRQKIISSRKKLYWENRDYYIKYGREYTKKVRLETLTFVGGANGIKCIKCGFDDKRALQIDHVNGGGLKEIRELKNNRKYLELIKSKPQNYQILCANCNWIKRHENFEGHAK